MRKFPLDPTGNFTQYETEDSIQTRTHNTANEITSISGLNPINHDRNGNMTSVPQPENWPSNYDLTYDAWNRLVSVKDGATVIATYTYDALNRRVKKTTSSETREFYYNRRWQCVEEYVENTQVAQYLWGIRYIDDLTRVSLNNQWLTVLQDANFNVVALLNGSAVVECYTYNAFGTRQTYDASFNPRATSSYPSFTRTFTGQLLDPETGLMLYRNRHYHPTLGRFIQRDPIGYAAGDRNLYRYCANVSINAVDPEGYAPSMTSAGYRELKDRTACCEKITPVTASAGWDDHPYRRRFLQFLKDTGTVFMSKDVNDMLEQLDNHVGNCQCIEKLTINSHGFSNYHGGFHIGNDQIDIITGATKGTEFGEALKGAMCEPCVINIMACYSADDNKDTIMAIAKETKCTVRGVYGVFTRIIGVNPLRGRWSQWKVEFGAVECDPAGNCTPIFVAGSDGMHSWY